MWRILLEKFQSKDHEHHVRGNIVLSVKREIYTICESLISCFQNSEINPFGGWVCTWEWEEEFQMRKFNIQNHHRCDMASSCTSVGSSFLPSLSGDHIWGSPVSQPVSQQRHDKLVMGKNQYLFFYGIKLDNPTGAHTPGDHSTYAYSVCGD